MEYIADHLIDDKVSKCFVENGDIVIAMSGATTGKVAINNSGQKILQNQRVGRFIISDDTLRQYIYLYLISMVNDNLEKSLGAAQPNLSTAQINGIRIPLPPLNEQKRIVSKLDALFTRIDTAIIHLQETSELSKALFVSALDSKYRELDEQFEGKELGSIARIVSGYAFKSSDFREEGKVRSVKITNVGLSEFMETDGDYLPEDFADKYDRFAVKVGDIVIALTRSIINGGLKTCRVTERYDGALVNQRVAALAQPVSDGSLGFIYWYLKSTTVFNYVLDKSRSLMQPNLSIKDLGQLSIPWPKLTEQEETFAYIAALAERTSTLETETKERLEQLTTLKSSLLDAAFRGQL
jgi:type I restriction enzyme S subunit